MAKNADNPYKTGRKQSGLTQKQAVTALHLSDEKTLSNYENGHRNPDSQKVAGMIGTYRCPRLALDHAHYTMPELSPWLPEINDLQTIGCMHMALSKALDAIENAMNAIKLDVFNAKEIAAQVKLGMDTTASAYVYISRAGGGDRIA